MVIPKVEGKLSVAEKLFVLPTFVVAVHDHSGVELSDGVQVVVFLFKVLVPAAAADFHAVVDVVPPIDAEFELVARLQRPWQIDPHHRFVDGVIQSLARCIGHFLDFESPVK